MFLFKMKEIIYKRQYSRIKHRQPKGKQNHKIKFLTTKLTKVVRVGPTFMLQTLHFVLLEHVFKFTSSVPQCFFDSPFLLLELTFSEPLWRLWLRGLSCPILRPWLSFKFRLSFTQVHFKLVLVRPTQSHTRPIQIHLPHQAPPQAHLGSPLPVQIHLDTFQLAHIHSS